MSLSPEQRLRLIASDLRIVGAVLIILGSAFIWFVVGQSPSLQGKFYSGFAVPLLLAPGIWFVIASAHIRRGSLPIVKWSIWIVSAQCVGLLLGVIAYLLAEESRIVLRRDAQVLLGPAFLLVFVFPAESVLVVQLFRAGWLIRAHEVARGFDIGTIPHALPLGEVVDPNVHSVSDRVGQSVACDGSGVGQMRATCRADQQPSDHP